MTKNALTFNAPWNIVYMPKLFDPFTGHESKGDITKKFTEELKTYGRIYMYRFMPNYEIKARHLEDFPHKSKQAASRV